MSAATKSPSMSKTECAALHREAHAAGLAALKAATPTPMVWGKPSTPLGSDVAVVQGVDYEGACGFAWVEMPGTTSFARWARAKGLAKTSEYHRCTMLWVREGGQSYERKVAYASAYAGVLTSAGLQRVRANGRMD